MPAPERTGDTRASILTAARRRFATEGFRSATIRAIARDAGVDPAMVMRHYGSKEQLFAAAVDVDLHIPDLRDAPRETRGERLVEHFLSRWDEDTPEGKVLLTLLRSAAVDPTIAARMRELFASQLLPPLSLLIADQSEVSLRAGLVASQMLGLAMTRSVLALPPMVSMSQQAIAANIGATLQRYLNDPLVLND